MGDNCFTRTFLKKYPLIEDQTIEALVTNGYLNEGSLLFMDLNEDLPAITEISRGQKGVMKRVLSDFQKSQKNLKKNFEKLSETLSESCLAINNSQTYQSIGVQNTVSPPLISSTPQLSSLLPTLTPFDHFVGFNLMSGPSTSRELAPIPTTSSDTTPAIPHETDILSMPSNSSSPLLSPIPSISRSSGPSTSRSITSPNHLSVSSFSRGSHPPTNGRNVRRFVEFRRLKKVSKEPRNDDIEVIACDESTDSRWFVRPVIESEDKPIVVSSDGSQLTTNTIIQELTVEESHNKTTISERSVDNILDESLNRIREEIKEEVTQSLSSVVGLPKNGKEEEESDGLKTNSESERKKTKTSPRKRRLKRFCYSEPRKKPRNRSRSLKETEKNRSLPIVSQFNTSIPLAHQGNYTKHDKKLFMCPVPDCGKVIKGSMRRHESSHSSEKPFKCETVGCGKAYKYKDGLKCHKCTDSYYSETQKKPKNESQNIKELERKRSQCMTQYICHIDGCVQKFAYSEQLVAHRLTCRLDPTLGPNSSVVTRSKSKIKNKSCSDSLKCSDNNNEDKLFASSLTSNADGLLGMRNSSSDKQIKILFTNSSTPLLKIRRKPDRKLSIDSTIERSIDDISDESLNRIREEQKEEEKEVTQSVPLVVHHKTEKPENDDIEVIHCDESTDMCLFVRPVMKGEDKPGLKWFVVSSDGSQLSTNTIEQEHIVEESHNKTTTFER